MEIRYALSPHMDGLICKRPHETFILMQSDATFKRSVGLVSSFLGGNHLDITFLDTSMVRICDGCSMFNIVGVYIRCKNLHT